MQRRQLIATLKRALRSRGLTYADVARRLELSEATVKRVFHRGDLTLSRLEEICELAGLQLSDLMERMTAAQPLVSELTPEQERELIADPKLLLMSYLLMNRWDVADITRRFAIEANEAKHLLRRLRDLELIEILPFDRIKVLTARNFSWRRDGPVQRYFLEQVQRDFFDARFDAPDDVLYLLGGLLSEDSRRIVAQRMRRLAAEIDELSKQDARLPREKRSACGTVVALRPWEFSAFTALRR
jgi:transcriptional regulator with XRE-family HTH domain